MTVLLALLLLAAPDEKITKQNWRTHPRIEAVRKKVEVFEKSSDPESGELLVTVEKRGGCEQPSMDMERTVWRDAKGRIIKYQWGGGSSASAYTMTTTYDADGSILFVFIRNGSDLPLRRTEQRIYFQGGEELWRDTRELNGGLPYGEELIRDPEKALNAPKDCNTAQ